MFELPVRKNGFMLEITPVFSYFYMTENSEKHSSVIRVPLLLNLVLADQKTFANFV